MIKIDDLENHPIEYKSPFEFLPKNIPEKKVDKHIHSEIHELVANCRKDFGETALKGKGSFGFYLGYFNRLGASTVYRILSELKQSGKQGQVKLFWWKVKQELELRKKNKSSK